MSADEDRRELAALDREAEYITRIATGRLITPDEASTLLAAVIERRLELLSVTRQ